MEITRSNNIIINDIMYSCSIVITSLKKNGDGITAQLFTLFFSLTLAYIIHYFTKYVNIIRTYFNIGTSETAVPYKEKFNFIKIY